MQRRRLRNSRPQNKPQHWNDCCRCYPYVDWYDYDNYYDDDYRPYDRYEYAQNPMPPKPKASNIDGMDNGWYNYSADDIQQSYKQGFKDGWAACMIYCMADSDSETDKPMSKPMPKIEDVVE